MFKIRSDLKMVLPVPESKVKEKKNLYWCPKRYFTVYIVVACSKSNK